MKFWKGKKSRKTVMKFNELRVTNFQNKHNRLDNI